jgi:hypothetical protein
MSSHFSHMVTAPEQRPGRTYRVKSEPRRVSWGTPSKGSWLQQGSVAAYAMSPNGQTNNVTEVSPNRRSPERTDLPPKPLGWKRQEAIGAQLDPICHDPER